MQKLLLPFLLCLCLQEVRGQDLPVKFGKVKLDDLKMKVYPQDSSANAVLLFDYGETDFEIKATTVYTRFTYHGRYKILKKSALNKAMVSIQYQVNDLSKYSESIFRIKGITYNLENGTVKQEELSKDMIFHEKTSSSIHTVRFVLPNVREGSVIEYTYERLSPITSFHRLNSWTFQSEIPVLWSEYRIKVPDGLLYRMILSGSLPLYINENKPTNKDMNYLGANGIAYRFVIKDIPAFRSEPFITTPEDYISEIDFELVKVSIPGRQRNYAQSWSDLTSTFLNNKDLGGRLTNTSYLKNIAIGLKATSTDTLSQVKAALQFVHERIKWNGETSLQGVSAQRVLDTKVGDSGDINIFLIALLKEMG